MTNHLQNTTTRTIALTEPTKKPTSKAIANREKSGIFQNSDRFVDAMSNKNTRMIGTGALRFYGSLIEMKLVSGSR